MVYDGRARSASDRWQLSRLPASLGRTAVALVILLSFAGAVVAWLGESNRAEDRNRVLSLRAASALETIMRATGESLLGAQALGVNGVVERDEFESFSSGVVLDSEFKQLFYLPILGDAQRAAFERSIDGTVKDRPATASLGVFVTAPHRDEYAPISMVWPTSSTTKTSLGFDYLGDPIRGPALQQARALGAPRASGPLVAAQNGRIALAVVVPVFKDYRVTSATAAPTRKSLVGYVGGTVYGDQLGLKVSQLIPDTTSLRISDGDSELFRSDRAFKGRGQSTTLEILGRKLTVATDAEEGVSLTWPALIVLAGLSVAGFIGRSFAVSVSRNEAITRAAEELDRAHRSTSALQELTARLATSSSSTDMANALTVHLRTHEHALLGSAVLMFSQAAIRTEGSIDNLPDSLVEVLTAEQESPLIAPAISGRALFGGLELDGYGLDPATVAILPLTRGGVTVALLALVYTSPQRFDAEHRLRLTTVGALGSQSLERALRYDEEHAMATSLQRSLLPQTLPSVPGIELAVRYIPAVETALVGGDWYDAFDVGNGFAFVVGDAVGHGVEAASAMGQIRSATRVAMLTGASPAEALQVLDTFAAQVPGASDATAIVALFDAERHEVQLSRAGHIPPLLVRDGVASFVEDGGSLPLGWPDHERPLASLALRDGDVLIALTDGVVERRGIQMSDRLDELAAICATSSGDLETMCDVILHRMDVERPTDDVALLVVRYSATS